MYVVLGAIPGALIRWIVDNTIAVNICGALFLGILLGTPYKFKRQLIIGVGFCGSLTTFSTWIFRCSEILLDGNYLKASIAILVPLTLGLLFALIGYLLGRFITLSLRHSR